MEGAVGGVVEEVAVVGVVLGGRLSQLMNNSWRTNLASQLA